jgi:hypothetical protein
MMRQRARLCSAASMHDRSERPTDETALLSAPGHAISFWRRWGRCGHQKVVPQHKAGWLVRPGAGALVDDAVVNGERPCSEVVDVRPERDVHRRKRNLRRSACAAQAGTRVK